MNKVIIVTDSSAYLPQEIVEQYHLPILPLVLNWQGRQYRDGVDISAHEFYTQLCDIESELKFYKTHFKDRVVYCNCDDPRISNFFKYFTNNFEDLKIKKLLTSCYREQSGDLFGERNQDSGFFFEYANTSKEKSKLNPPENQMKRSRGD